MSSPDTTHHDSLFLSHALGSHSLFFSLSSFPPLPQAYPPRTPLNISPPRVWLVVHILFSFPVLPRTYLDSPFPSSAYPLALSSPLLLYYSYALSSSSATSLVYFFLCHLSSSFCPYHFCRVFLSRLLMICFHAVFDTYDFVTSFLIWLH